MPAAKTAHAQQNGSAVEKNTDLLLSAAENAQIVAEMVLNIKRSYKRIQLQRMANQESINDPVNGTTPDPKGKWTDPVSGEKYRTYAQQERLFQEGLAAIKAEHSDIWGLIEEKQRELGV